MVTLTDVIREDPDTFVQLPVPDIACLLLQHAKTQGRYRPNVFVSHETLAVEFAQYEAWAWLLREGLVCHDHRAAKSDYFFITRRGEEVDTEDRFVDFTRGNLLPAALLNADLRQRVMPLFLKGDYDTAVFKALKKVEISVREAVSELEGTPCARQGVDLMRHASRKEGGPLDDDSITDINERGSYGHMFAGVFGCYRNPTGHRDIEMAAVETVEIIMMANHLLRIVDAALARRSSAGVTT